LTDQPGREERIPIKAKLAQQLQERVKKYRENSASAADSLKRDPERPVRENQANRERVIAEFQVLAEL